MASQRYQAFISYSHQSDARLASSLQSSLSRFAKPWYRLRTMRIFLDKTSLAANPALWPTIEQALGQSEHFLFLASPTSANSRWVQQEVQWWLQNRSVEKLVICLTDGEILWDSQAGDFNWEKTTAIPLILKGAFPAEPLYADFRGAKAADKYADSDPAYRGALLDVAAPVMGRPKDDLDGEDIRLHRKAERTAWAVSIFIVLLAVIAGVGMSMAHQRQKLAASRALASEATSHVDDRSLAMLLSIESRRIADTVESRRSLLALIQRVPHAEVFLWGHTDAVTKAIFSPDGKTVLSAGWDDRILLWTVATHQPNGSPIATAKGLVSVAFSPDGSRFAATSNGAVTLYDTRSHRPVGEPFVAKENFVHVGFSLGGKLLAASTDAYGGHPASVFVWDIANHQQIGEPIPGSYFAFSPDDSLLAIARYDSVVLYDLRSHHEVRRALTGPGKNIASLAFSPDGTIVAAGGEDQTIVLWDLQSQKQIGQLAGHTSTVNTLFFDPDGETLLSGSLDGTIIRWDLEDMKAIDTPVKGFGASISSIFISPDGHLKSLALDKDRVIILNVNDDPPLGRRIKAPGSSSANVALSSDGRLLASSGEFGDVAVWDVASGEESGSPLSGHERQVSSLAFAPDGKQLVSGSMDGTVIFWDVASRAALGPTIKAFRSPVWSLACSPDGKTAVAGGDAVLVSWELATRKQLGPPNRSQKDRIWTLAFSPSGDLLASAGNNLVVDLWKAGIQSDPFKTFGSPMQDDIFELMPVGVGFSSDGTLLASSTRDHSVTLWNVRSGKPLPPLLYGHTQAVTSVSFSGDGKVLASGSADDTIRLWDVQTHELIGVLDAQQKAVNHIVFAPQKATLASVGDDDSIILWDVDFDGWANQACRIANRNLTLKEWNTYIGSRPYKKTCPNIQ